MSKELQVEVEQTVGSIHWNFEELKAALAEKMDDYKGLVYTEDTVREAQKDVANLRKLRKSVDDRRKEIKKKCMEPYNIIEKQAKELIALIDAPIEEIATQVENYETDRKAKKKAEIFAFMDEQFREITAVDEGITEKLKAITYDVKWENKTCADEIWQTTIKNAAKNTLGDIGVIENLDEEFVKPCIEAYKINLVLSDAMNKAAELRRQKEIVLEKERQRQEAIRRQKEEEARAKIEAEKQRAEAEKRRAEEAEKQAQIEKEKAERAKREAEAARVAAQKASESASDDRMDKSKGEAPENIIESISNTETDDNGAPKADDEYWILFKGSMEQYNKVLAYIRYIQAEVKEVRKCS